MSNERLNAENITNIDSNEICKKLFGVSYIFTLNAVLSKYANDIEVEADSISDPILKAKMLGDVMMVRKSLVHLTDESYSTATIDHLGGQAVLDASCEVEEVLRHRLGILKNSA
jgi:hypothetical protein